MLYGQTIFLFENLKVFSIGNPGNLTYPYKIIGKDTKVLKDIFSGNHEITNIFRSSKKPIVIIGESAIENESGKYILGHFER